MQRSYYSVETKRLFSESRETRAHVHEVKNPAGEVALDADILRLLQRINSPDQPDDLNVRNCLQNIRDLIVELICFEPGSQGMSLDRIRCRLQDLFVGISSASFKIGGVAIGVPPQVAYTFEPKAKNPAADLTLLFLNVYRRTDVKKWARCENCNNFFIRRRLNLASRFCHKNCRYEFHNSKSEKREEKRVLAQQRRRQGDIRYMK